MGSGNQNPRSFGGIFNFQDIHLNPLRRLEYLALYHLVFIENGVYLAQVNAHIPAEIALHHACHHIPFFSVILVVEDFALFFPDLLKNHVLCVLGGNAPKLLGLNRHIYNVSQLILGIHHLSARQADFHNIILHLLHHSLLRIDGKLTGLRIDVYLYIICLSKMVLARRKQGILNRLQQSFFADVFLSLQNFQSFQQLCVHSSLSSSFQTRYFLSSARFPAGSS